MEALIPLLGKVDNVAVFVLLIVCGGLWYMVMVNRREEREDRQKMLETFNKIAEALNELKIAIAASTGKQV